MFNPFENPFTADSKKAKKSLLAKVRNVLISDKNAEKNIEAAIKAVPYGPYEILPTELEFFYDLEDQLIKDSGFLHRIKNRDQAKKKILELMKQSQAPALEFDENGRIITLIIDNTECLKKIPASIVRLRNLHKLSMCNNKIESIPSNIDYIKHLQNIVLYANKIKSIPEGIYRLSELTDLNLFENKISELSDKIKNLKRLDVLWLGKNRLTKLPESLSELNLLLLFAADNLLTSIPRDLDKMPRLKQLNLALNKLSTAEKNKIKKMFAGRSIDLDI